MKTSTKTVLIIALLGNACWGESPNSKNEETDVLSLDTLVDGPEAIVGPDLPSPASSESLSEHSSMKEDEVEAERTNIRKYCLTALALGLSTAAFAYYNSTMLMQKLGI